MSNASTTSDSLLMSVENLSFSLNDRTILNDFSFEIREGKIIALIGPNGSGKSTLLKLLAGVFDNLPYTGTIRFKEENYQEFSRIEKAGIVSYVPSDIDTSFPLSGYDSVMLGMYPHDLRSFFVSHSQEDEKVKDAMDRCGCWELRYRSILELSGGERQLLLLARAVVQDALLVFIDETTSQMDLNHQQRSGKVLHELAETGKTVVIVSHDLNFLTEIADEVILINKGKKLVHDRPELALNTKNLQELYPETAFSIGENSATRKMKIFLDGFKSK